MPDILDDELTLSYSKAPLIWWESKRLIYTILLSIEVLALVFINFNYYPLDDVIFLISLVLYIFVANIFYSMGWGLEILLKYYKVSFPIHKFRWTLWILGFVFSALLTIFWS